MSWRHGGELAIGMSAVIAIWIAALVLRIGPMPLVLAAPVGALFVLLTAIAGWRLYRRQAIALESTRSLLDSNAVERDDLERHLANRYRRREQRINNRNNERVERLDGEIAVLHDEALSHALEDAEASCKST